MAKVIDDGVVSLLRPYAHRVFFLLFGVFFVAAAVALAGLMIDDAISWAGWIFCGLAALASLWLGIISLRYAVLPFRIDIDRIGWTVRTPDFDRYLRWDEIETVAVADGPKRSTLLLVVPAPGVRLDAKATLDGRPAASLFRLDEIAYDEARFVHDLAELAGDRFQNRVARLEGPVGEALSGFPDVPDHRRLRRWLNRRTALLYAGWYLLALLPALALVVLAEQVHELLGVAALLVGLVGVAVALGWVVSIFSGCRDLADRTATLDGTDVVTWAYGVSRRIPLQSGEVTVLPPKSKRGYGQAWLLADPQPGLLLSDPRTGLRRGDDDLRRLSAILRASAHETDRAAANDLDRLAAASPREVSSPAQTAYGADLWISLTGILRVAAWFAVVATIALAGGIIVETSAFVGPALILGAVALFGVWILYALYRLLGLLGALARVAGRAFYARG